LTGTATVPVSETNNKPQHDRKSESAVFATSHGKSIVKWILDLGATEHIVNDPKVLSAVTTLFSPNSFITAAGAVNAGIKGMVRVFAGRRRDHFLTIGNVFCLPSSPANLLSHGLLLDRGWDIQVTADGGYMQTEGVVIKLHRSGHDGHLREVVMELAPFAVKGAAAHFTTKPVDTIAQWHIRLGHMGISTLKTLEKDG
jgi:hypothetical protein